MSGEDVRRAVRTSELDHPMKVSSLGPFGQSPPQAQLVAKPFVSAMSFARMDTFARGEISDIHGTWCMQGQRLKTGGHRLATGLKTASSH